MLVPQEIVITQSLNRKFTVNYNSTGVELTISAKYNNLSEEQIIEAKKDLSDALFSALNVESDKAMESMNEYLKGRRAK